MIAPGMLVTADGAVFQGTSVGAGGVSTGEVIFNTSMTGYQEILTDPSYAGQVVVMTSSHIGNYGVSSEDDQADHPHLSGFVMRSISRRESSWRSEGSLAERLRSDGVVALSDIDTRRLTRHIRERGSQPVAIGSGTTTGEMIEAAAAAPHMTGLAIADQVGTDHRYNVAAQGTTRGRVVAIDLGMKRDILRRFTSRGIEVEVVPANTSADDISSESPDAVFLSNGPGDPQPLATTVATVRHLLGSLPVIGICLGHQILGLALGATTFKLPFGHHGSNHPVRRMADGRVEITAQNHGFAVDLWSMTAATPPGRHGLVTSNLLPDSVVTPFGTVVPTHQNLNDGTLEGLRCDSVDAIGVQFHPEAAPGPNDATHLFDEFCDEIVPAVDPPPSGGRL